MAARFFPAARKSSRDQKFSLRHIRVHLTRSGCVFGFRFTTGFLYATNSETEIDMEQVGNKPDAVDCTNWHGVSNFQDTQVFGFDQGNSHDFKIVWQPGLCGLVRRRPVGGPSHPGRTQRSGSFLFSAWGTNSSSWGGTATIGPTRYMYVSSFKYTP